VLDIVVIHRTRPGVQRNKWVKHSLEEVGEAEVMLWRGPFLN
jgi:hypothetical protein